MSPAARGRERPLSREEVVEAALTLSRRVGLEGLTMRELASRLGVSPMATYHYVANKRELIELVVEAVGIRFARLVPDGRPWEDTLRTYVIEAWDHMREYPGIDTHARNWPRSDSLQSVVDQGIVFFRLAGFPPGEAEMAWTFTSNYLRGRVAVDARLERANGTDPPARRCIEFGAEMLVRGLRSRLDELTSPDSDSPDGERWSSPVRADHS